VIECEEVLELTKERMSGASRSESDTEAVS
jgi:hypothetical protein